MKITQKFKGYMLTLTTLLTMLAPVALPVAVHACSSAIASGVAAGASTASGGTVDCSNTNVNNTNIAQVARDIVNIFSIVVGGVAIIMIIYGGFRYITSGGDTNRVSGAKNTLIYAIIGLIIVALAQLIVHFVLSQTNSVASGSTPS